MTKTEEKEMYEDIVVKLNKICETDDSLISSLSNVINGNFLNIEVDNKIFEEENFTNSLNDTINSKDNIKSYIIPSINAEIERLKTEIEAEKVVNTVIVTVATSSNSTSFPLPTSSSSSSSVSTSPSISITPTSVPTSNSLKSPSISSSNG